MDKQTLLAAMKLKRETVTVAGSEVIVTELSAEDYMSIYESPLCNDEEGKLSSTKFAALMCVRSMVDEKGERILADEDAEAFRKGSSGVFCKINAAVNRLNALTGDEVKN